MNASTVTAATVAGGRPRGRSGRGGHGALRPPVRHTRRLLAVVALAAASFAFAQAPSISDCPTYLRPTGDARGDHHRCLRWFLERNRATLENLQVAVPRVRSILNDSFGESVQAAVMILGQASVQVESAAERSAITWLLLDHGTNPFREYEFTNVFERLGHDSAIAATLVAWADQSGRVGRGLDAARERVGPARVAWASDRNQYQNELAAEQERQHEAERLEQARVAEEERLAREAAAEAERLRDAVAADPQFILTLAQTGTTADLAFVLSAGASLDVVDAYGQSPLVYAAGANTAAMVSALLRHGVDVNHTTAAGWTALHYAVRDNADTDVIRVLIEGGVDPSIRNQDGRSALDLARDAGRADAEAALVGALDARAVQEDADAAAARTAAEAAAIAERDAPRRVTPPPGPTTDPATYMARALDTDRSTLQPGSLRALTVGASYRPDEWHAAVFRGASSGQDRLIIASARSNQYCTWVVGRNPTLRDVWPDLVRGVDAVLSDPTANRDVSTMIGRTPMTRSDALAGIGNSYATLEAFLYGIFLEVGVGDSSFVGKSTDLRPEDTRLHQQFFWYLNQGLWMEPDTIQPVLIVYRELVAGVRGDGLHVPMVRVDTSAGRDTIYYVSPENAYCGRN